jgi:hypothetical protein
MATRAQQPTIGDDVYTGVAVYGRIRAVLGAVVGIVIMLTLIVIGTVRLRDPHTATAMMEITAATCYSVKNAQGHPTGYSCDISVRFLAADGRWYVAPHVGAASAAPLSVGKTIALRYDPAHPASVVQETMPRALGWALIGGGLLVGGGMTALAVLSFKSKGFAALEGAAGIAGMAFGR